MNGWFLAQFTPLHFLTDLGSFLQADDLHCIDWLNWNHSWSRWYPLGQQRDNLKLGTSTVFENKQWNSTSLRYAFRINTQLYKVVFGRSHTFHSQSELLLYRETIFSKIMNMRDKPFLQNFTTFNRNNYKYVYEAKQTTWIWLVVVPS